MEIITRQEYMKDSSNLHDKYYGQFVNSQILSLVVNIIGKKRINESICEHMNDIPLRLWDSISMQVNFYCTTDRKKAGECNSIATGVCIGKAAARLIKGDKSS